MIRSIALAFEKAPTWVKNTLLIIGSSLVLGLFANVAIPLPFTPVPIATQPAIVLMLGVLLGSKRALAAVGAFLGQAAFGLPVLAGGVGGIVKFAGPTAGYIVGYLIAAFVVGKISEAPWFKRTALNALWAMAVGNVILFILGAAWLATFVGLSKAIVLGVVPFLLGDALKLVLSMNLLQWFGCFKKAA